MDTSYILMWLEGPLQAWGYNSEFSLRDTLEFPTKSGITGLLFSAMGEGGPQKELLSEFAALSLTVISYSNGQAESPHLVDYQIVGNGYDSNDSWESLMIPKKRDGSVPVGGGSKLTYRHYLQGAIFSAIAEVPEYLSERIAASLASPIWPIFLGRRTCIPSAPIYCGVAKTPAEGERILKEKADKRGLHEGFRVIDGRKPDDGEVLLLNDIPISFGTCKKYRSRYVTVIKSSYGE